MDWVKIEQLIETYYEGNTTVAQDQELFNVLQRADCPEHLAAELLMMNYFSEERDIESTKLQINLSKAEPKKGKLIQFVSRFSGMAAAIVLVGLFFFNQADRCINNGPVLAVINNKKICDEAIARQEAREALQLVSQRLNQATSKLEYIDRINTPNQISKK